VFIKELLVNETTAVILNPIGSAQGRLREESAGGLLRQILRPAKGPQNDTHFYILEEVLWQKR
jgi:hypothetical protein